MIKNKTSTLFQTLHKNRILILVNSARLLICISICMVSIIYINKHQSNNKFYGERNVIDVKSHTYDKKLLFSQLDHFPINPYLVSKNYCRRCMIYGPRLKSDNTSKKNSLFMILGALNDLDHHTNNNKYQYSRLRTGMLNSSSWLQLPIMNYAVYNTSSHRGYDRKPQPNIEIRL